MLIRPKKNSLVMMTVMGTFDQIQKGKGTIVMGAGEAISYLGISKARLHQLRAEGKLRPVGKAGSTFFYRQEDLDLLLK